MTERGTQVQVRGRWHSGDGVLQRMTAKMAWVLLDGEKQPRQFARKSVRVIRFCGVRLRWESSPTLEET